MLHEPLRAVAETFWLTESDCLYLCVFSFGCHRKGPGVCWTLGLQSIPTQAHKCGSVGIRDDSP